MTCNIPHESDLAKELQETKLIIFDEAPMMSKDVFHALDRTLRGIMGDLYVSCREVPFGGIPFVLGGDFRQILPVIRKGGRGQIVSACINQSQSLWSHVVRLRLRRNERLNQNVDNTWAQFLLDVGDGTAGDKVTLPNTVSLCANVEDLISNVFGNRIDNTLATNRAIICPKLENVDIINNIKLEKLQAPEKTYESADSVLDEDGSASDMYSTEFLNSLSFSGMPPHNLKLKIGAIVLCMRNLDKKNGLCNGTRLRITQLHDRYVEGSVVTEGAFFGQLCTIPRVPITPSDTGLQFQFERNQLPLTLGFAITINKSQ